MAARSSSNEIRLTRVYEAPVRAVWHAWTIPEQVENWWGPRGFTLTTHFAKGGGVDVVPDAFRPGRPTRGVDRKGIAVSSA